ncbi:MAG: tetraacyldisaccharide 4'-kinase [Candidatus Neomarinimicrobiota bacterium]|nr:tetraacyldisaccharide 4'-kinase [Candidatus Neomarinimicrobiota bacterium]
MFRLIRFILFIPLAFIYKFIIEVRFFLYNNNFNKITEFKTPIISVGNITVGGTGKTPMVHFLAKELINQYHKIAILSRGYGRKSSGYKVVSDGVSTLSNHLDSGDEPFLLSKLLKNCIVVVDENRIRGIKNIQNQFNPDLIILDDGFQQLSIKKNVDIVLINASKEFSELKLLPFGVGREPIGYLERANFLIFTKAKEFEIPIWESKLNFKNNLYCTDYRSKVVAYNNGYFKSIDILPKSIFAFCGIADPNSFKSILKEKNIFPSSIKIFKDHQSYSKKSLRLLSKEILDCKTENIITTEKDLVKLPDYFTDNYNVYVIRIEHIFEDKELFLQQLKSLIKEKK